MCGERLCLSERNVSTVKEDVSAQASKLYVRDDKSILQELSWSSTKGRCEVEDLDLSGRIILK